MEDFGYSIVMKEANFAAASSIVKFELIPDDVENIPAWGDEGQDGHGPQYRRYEILDTDGNRLFAGMTGGTSHGLDRSKTKLTYAFDFQPLESVPQEFIIVPVNDDGTYAMDEAASIPVIPG